MAHAILRFLAILLLAIVDSAPAPSHISRNCRAQSSAAGVFSYVLASVVGAIPVPCSDVPKANQSVMTLFLDLAFALMSDCQFIDHRCLTVRVPFI
jgi:hypothetical protein